MLRLILGLVLLTLIGSFLGVVHPLGDSLAVFRGQIALAALMLASGMAVFGRDNVGRAGVVLALAGGLTVWPFYVLPVSGAKSLSSATASTTDSHLVYQKNLSFRMPHTRLIEQDIRASGAELVTLQEVDADNEALVRGLADRFPSQAICPFSRRVGAVAALSQWPRTKEQTICGNGLAAIQVEGPAGPVWLVSIHLHWPYPHGQARQVERIMPILDDLKGAVVVGGDFNMVPYASAPRRMRRATGTRPMPALRSSFPAFAPLVPLPIDHVFAGDVVDFQLRPLLGSDHAGVLAKVGLSRN